MQKNGMFAVISPGVAVRPWFRKFARSVTITFRQDRLLAQLGASAAWQFAVLPSDITGLVEQIRLVETEAIRWGGRPPRKYRSRGLIIIDGDWDTRCKQPIDTYLRSYTYGLSIHELVVEGRPYIETTQYSQMVEQLKRGDNPKGCASIAEIDAYFDRLQRACWMIRTEGYKSQTELDTGLPDDEIMVYVDRNGELQKQQGSGHHRLAIARLLKVQHVPVCIRGIHRRWVEQCYNRFGGDLISALRQDLAERLPVQSLCGQCPSELSSGGVVARTWPQ
jgi:hypothetical protein